MSWISLWMGGQLHFSVSPSPLDLGFGDSGTKAWQYTCNAMQWTWHMTLLMTVGQKWQDPVR